MATRATQGGASALPTLFAAPVLSYGIMPEIKGDPDAAIIAAWNLRQTSLATMEARGSFFSYESHSQAEGDTFDAAEEAVFKLHAATPRGILAKAWVSLSHTGDGFTEVNATNADSVRRADFGDVRAIMEAGDFDYHQDVLASLIGDLIAMTEA